jgi:hypothetical protein
MRVVILAALIAASTACLESGPGTVGDLLGKSPEDLQSELSITLGEWEPWQAAHSYLLSSDYDHSVSFYGHDWHLTAFRQDSLVNGIFLEAPYPGSDEFRQLIDEIASDEEVEPTEDGIYWVQYGGNLVHFTGAPDEGMFLMVTDHHMSATYESTILVDDLRFLDDALQPWAPPDR